MNVLDKCADLIAWGLEITSGGSVSNIGVTSGGKLRVLAGGTATNISVGQSGFVQVDSDGLLSNGLFIDGHLTVNSGGTAIGLDICEWSAADLYIQHGAIVTFDYKHPTEEMRNAEQTRSSACTPCSSGEAGR